MALAKNVKPKTSFIDASRPGADVRCHADVLQVLIICKPKIPLPATARESLLGPINLPTPDPFQWAKWKQAEGFAAAAADADTLCTLFILPVDAFRQDREMSNNGFEAVPLPIPDVVTFDREYNAGTGGRQACQPTYSRFICDWAR